MKKLLALSFLLLVFFGKSSAQFVLSPEAEISVVTCGMGDDLYALFGHTAIRIKDDSQDLDRVYNFGTFSFSNDFYQKFVMGQLRYKLSAYGYDGFESEYEYYGRSIDRQVLKLNPDQKNLLYEKLEINALPSNAYYLYDFFYDNCSTRQRDVLSVVFDDQIVFPDLTESEPKTFRQLIDEYLIYAPWSDFGIDLGLGSYCDTLTSTEGYMFLPDYLYKALEGANTPNGKLVSVSENVFTPETERSSSTQWSDPIVVFWLFFILSLMLNVYEWRKNKHFLWFDRVLFSIVGLLGLLVAFLWFATDHLATKANWNILWAFPLNFPFAFFVFSKRLNKFQKYYQWFILSGIAISGLAWYLIPQDFHVAVFPILLALATRLSVGLTRKHQA